MKNQKTRITDSKNRSIFRQYSEHETPLNYVKYILGENYQKLSKKLKIYFVEMDLQTAEWGASWYFYFTPSFEKASSPEPLGQF